MKKVFVNTQPGRPHTMRASLNNHPRLKGTTMNESTIEGKDLVTLNEKNEAITTSLKVAEVFGKRHDNVLQAIDNLIAQDNSLALNFQGMEIIEKNALGRSFKIKHYEMDRDGFTYLALGFTGAKALKFKKEYVAAFNKMEEALKSRQPAAPELTSVETIRFLLAEHDKKDAEVKRLEAVTKKMAPKPKFYDAVSNARGNVNLTAAAKILVRGPRKMAACCGKWGSSTTPAAASTSRPSATSTPGTSWSRPR
jgi:Rha family phage regulatory protein